LTYISLIERLAEEERKREAEETAKVAEEEKRKKREQERAADMERIRKQREREEEAERRRQARSSTTPAVNPGEAWRRGPPRAEPAPSTRPTPTGGSRYVPPGARASEAGGGGRPGGWRERERMKEEANTSRPTTPSRQSPALPDEDGFQTVNRPRPSASTGTYRPPGARNR
jgi:hypothetical protein